MIPGRRQLPVYSPLSLGALAAGCGALLTRGATQERRIVERVRNRLGGGRVLLTDSGTTALTLALRGVVRADARVVALPAYCCFDVATAAGGADVQVALYDVDPGTLGPDLRSLQTVLERGVAAVVVAHLYGMPVDLGAVSRLLAGTGAILVEDAAQGADARHAGRIVGSFGSLAVLSFGRGKGRTGGGGGALVANDAAGEAVLASAGERLTGRARGAREVAGAAMQWMLGRPALYALPASLPFLHLGETPYRPPRPCAAAAPASLAVLRRAWALADDEAAVRCRNGMRLTRALERSAALSPIRPVAGAEPDPLRLAALASHVAGPGSPRLGIMPGYPRSLIDLDGFRDRVVNPDADYRGARRLANALLTFPTHSRLAERDLAALERWIERGAGP